MLCDDFNRFNGTCPSMQTTWKVEQAQRRITGQSPCQRWRSQEGLSIRKGLIDRSKTTTISIKSKTSTLITKKIDLAIDSKIETVKKMKRGILRGVYHGSFELYNTDSG